MSHSNFKLINNDEPLNSNLVIIVNKNGDVKTDTLALQNLLTSRDTPETGVTVIRETSPTPSISDEIEEERAQQIEEFRQQYIADHPNASEEDVEQQIKKIGGINNIPHVSLNLENFYAPDQARKFANDVLHLGGIENPSSLMPIDYNFRRQIVQNDHCYTPLTLSPKESTTPKESKKSSKAKGTKEQQSTKGKKEAKQSKARQSTTSVKEEDEDSTNSGDDQNEEDEDVAGEEEQSEETFSETDDDNDMDFSVNDRFGKKGKKKRKYRRQKQKSMTFKDFLEGGGDMSSMDDEPKKKYGKTSKKGQNPRVSGKSMGPSTSKNTQQSNTVRKIPNPTQQNKNAALRKEIQTPTTPLASTQTKSNNSTASTASSVIGQISIQSAAPAKSTQEIEFVESIVKDLEKSFPETDNKKAQIIPTTSSTAAATNSIPNIMQMMETNTPTEVIDQSLSSLEHIADGHVNIDEIGDALIAALGNEAIDELLNQGDLMNFDSTATTHVKPSQSIVSSSSGILSHSISQPILSDMNTTSLTASVSSPLPKILNKQATGKDPIKVVRNGRVITLPPIEAPATRGAKRRAQGDSTSPVGKVIKTENKTPSTKDPDSRNSSRRSSLNKSEKSESGGRNSRRQSTAQGNPDDEDDINSDDASWNSEDDPDRLWCICKQPHNNRFMICCDKCEDWFHGTCVNVTKAMGKDMERQDIKWHCPNCKSNAGAVKKDPNKKTLNQQKLTKFFSKHSKELTDEDVPKNSSDSLMCAVCHKKPARTDSIYCSEDCIRNHATKHLDDTNNAQPKTPTTPTSTKPTAGDGKRGNVLKDQSGNVIVYDRVSGKLLSSKLWPHFTSLGQWLSQNPNCEPVKPGSQQANQLLSKVSKNSQQPTTPTATSPKEAITSTSVHPPTTPHTPHAGTKHHHHHPAPIIPTDELFSNPVKINTGAKEVVQSPVLKKSISVNSPAIARSNSNNANTKSTPVRPTLTKQSSVSSSTSSKSVPLPKVQQDAKKVKRHVSDEKPQAQSTPSNSKLKIEYERQNVRSNLKSTMIQRMKDIEDSSVPKMKDEEIEKFATAIESEMFRFFNKDTRDKYKVKFRSLKFNLSDTKNKTLIERICMKKLTPRQLVELPSSELASKELSKWREEENKHQLEIITKAELDALAQTKMVIKTHKGEEILETKNTSADISLPDEDIESAIDKTVLSIDDPHHHKYDLSRSISLNVSGNHSVSSPLSSPSISSSTGRKSESHHNDSHSRSRSKSRGREHHSHHSHHKSSSKHKKSEHRHRSRSPKHHHSSHHHSSRDKSNEREHHSRDKSREKSNERDHSKKRSEDHHHHHHRDKSRSNEKEREREKTNSKSKDRETSKDSKKHHHTHNKDTKEAVVAAVVKKEEQLKEKIIPEIKPEQKDVDIVGKILDSMGVHLDTKPKTEDEKMPIKVEEIKSEVTSSSLVSDILPVSMDPVNEHQLEIEIYSGNMYMADVAKFDVTASVVSGNVDDIIKLFVPQMEIVGRIEPKTVWDYLGKVKKLPGKELAVIRFSSTDEAAYFSLFSYLHSRQRYGVIKSPAPNIKDFYLITVEAIRPLPPVLLPIVGPGFIEGEEHKPDLLLGVILKLTPEARHVQKKAPTVKKSPKTPKPVEHNVPIKILPSKHKPHSHCSSNKLTMGLPEVESGHMKSSPKISPDDDEPYEPLDDDSLTPPQLYAQQKSAGHHHGHHGHHVHHSASGEKLNTSDDLESQMEQLNREIERRQMEIQTLAQQKVLELNEEQASKIYENIRVPHNLSEILSTIKASEPKPMEIDDDDDDEEYVPSAAAAKGGMHEYRPSSSYPNVTQQQQQAPIVNSMMDIDERINLFRQEMPMNSLPMVQEQPSRLASMSDADLLALVPEDALQPPPPPIISSNSISESAIPGLEYEMEQ